MSTVSNVNTLKEHLEHLFPGQWVSGQSRPQTLSTGIGEIDRTLPRGLVRQRITEWIGTPSSGKTSLLRACIANWCVSGHNVAYIDLEGKLIASDWAFVEHGYCGTTPLNTAPTPVPSADQPGRFWVIRPGDSGKQTMPQAGWCADQLIRSNAFDVVILDFGSTPVRQSTKQGDRIYGRLQRSLSHTRTALLMIRDNAIVDSGWGCDTRLNFHWGKTIRCDAGLGGTIMILPSVNCSAWRDGMSRTEEVILNSHASNRLFTHPQVPDRRTSKA